MQLDELVFNVNTNELERADRLIAELSNSLAGLDRTIVNTQSKQSMADARAARAAKDTAKARLDNAKATEVEIKTEESKTKALEKSTQAAEKAEAASRKQGDSSDKVARLIKQESDTLEKLAQGLSLGEARRVAYARSLGMVAEQEKELIDLQEQQRKFRSDPFDNSAAGVAKLNKELVMLKDAYRMNTAGLDLTAKQTRDLTKDKLRLIESAKLEGQSLMSVREQIRNLNADYISTANSLNTYAAAEKASLQSKKDIASATRMITNEDEKMAAALSQTNSQLNKASTDLLVRYETGLRKMGLSQDEMTKKLGVYKTQLASVAAEEEKRASAHLARALSPQLTDIAVSLYSGQAPLTVLLQQGGQIADLFRLSGVEAQNFGKAMRDAFGSMIPVIGTVVKGMGQFAASLVVDGTKGLVNFIATVTGMNAILDMATSKLNTMGKVGEGLATVLTRIAGVAATVATVALTALAALAVGVAVGFKKAIDEQDNLARTLAQTGASLGLTQDAAIQMAKGMEGMGVSTSKAIAIIGEIAKTSNFASEDITKITKAASDMEKYGGVAIEKTVETFSKMKEKPVEALIELQKQTGRVRDEAIKSAADFLRQGEAAKAAGVAVDEYARVTETTVDKMKGNLSGFAKFVINVGNSIKNFFSDTFKALWYATDPTQKIADMEKNIAQLRERAKNGGNQIDDRNLRIAEKQLAEYRIKVDKEVNDAKAEQAAASSAKIQAVYAKLDKDIEDAADKRNAKTLSLTEFTEKFIQKKKEDLAISNQINASELQFTKEQTKALEAQAKADYTKLHKKEISAATKQATRDQEAYNDTLNKGEGLTATYNNTLASMQRMREKGVITEDEYIKAVEALILQQPFATEQAKEYNKAQELRNKLFDQGENLGANYTKTLLQIAEAEAMMRNGKPVFSPEEIQKMKEVLETLTPAYKKNQKAIEDSAKAYNKYSLEAQKTLDTVELENAKLDDRQALLGLTSDAQEKLSREQKIRNQLLEVELKLQRDIQKIRNDPKLANDPIGQLAAISEVERAAGEERKMINRQVAIQAAEDYDKEFRKIKEGISESLVEALFNGGKAGSKKLREFIIAELRKPITIVINALVNTLFQPLGNVVGGLFGGGAGGGSGVLSFLSMGKDIVSAIQGGFSALSGQISTYVQSGLNWLSGSGGMISQGPIQVGGFAQGIGTVGGYAAGALGGIYGGRLIGDGYSLNGGSGNGTINAGTAVGAILGGPVGALIGGLLGGVVNRLFGKKLVGSGIEGVVGGATDFEGNTYEKYKGGLFRRGGTDREKLDEPTRAAFAKTYSTFRDGIEGLASTLGFGEDALKDFTTTFKVELKGLSEEEAAKAIEAEFARISEMMADTVLGTKEYTKEGETQLEALTRLSVSLVTVNSSLETLGLKMFDTSLAGADMASALVDAFGSIENLKNATAAYYENYYSAEEKRATLTSQLTKQFEAMHLTIPKTREEFRKMVDGLDLTTEEGRKMYAFLIQISPLFAQIADSTEELAKAAADLKKQIEETRWSLENDLLRAQGNETEAVRREREKELEALRKLDPALAELKAEIWATEDAAKATAAAEAKANAEKAEAQKLAEEAERARKEAIQAAMNILTKAIQKEKEALQARIATANESINVLKSLFDLIESSIKDLYNQVDSTSKMTYANARKIISGAVTTTQAGGQIADIAGLDNAIKDAMSGLNPNDYSTQIEYDRERLRLADELKKLRDTSKQELTTAEKELQALQAQVEKLDATLAYWQEQIDIANGTYTAVLSVEAAISNLQNALIGAWNSGNQGTGTTPGKGGGVLGGTETGTTGGGATKPKNGVIGYDAEGRAHYADGSVGKAKAGENIYNDTGNVTASGITQEQWDAIKAGGEPFGGYWLGGKYYSNGRYKWDESQGLYVPAFAKGGNYAGGLALVGEDGPEMINFNSGGRVHTASDTSAMIGASARKVEMLEGIIVSLYSKLDKIESNTKNAADILRNVTPNGDSLQIEPVQV